MQESTAVQTYMLDHSMGETGRCGDLYATLARLTVATTRVSSSSRSDEVGVVMRGREATLARSAVPDRPTVGAFVGRPPGRNTALSREGVSAQSVWAPIPGVARVLRRCHHASPIPSCNGTGWLPVAEWIGPLAGCVMRSKRAVQLLANARMKRS